jgi:hypothetical protein
MEEITLPTHTNVNDQTLFTNGADSGGVDFRPSWADKLPIHWNSNDGLWDSQMLRAIGFLPLLGTPARYRSSHDWRTHV